MTGYDAAVRPISTKVPNVESLAFQYDQDDQITGITNGLNNAASQTLSYDADGRLNTVTGAEAASYSYDADGNRIQQVINGTTTNFTYASGSNQLIATSGGAGLANSYGYDANGNTVSMNGLSAYSYGPFNRLVNASGASFVISAEGQRLEKSGATGTTYFAPDSSGALLAENDAGNWHDNVWLNGRLVEVIAGGKVYTVASDQTGRPVALTDATTAIVWQATGLPFDRTVTANTWGDFNIGFPGQYRDAESGLWHNGYRDYDAATGRFIESDPIGLAGGVNVYAYVSNNPLSFVDLLGLCCSSLQKFAANAADVVSKEADAFADAALIADGFAAADVAAEIRPGGSHIAEGISAAGYAAVGSAAAQTAAVGASTAAALDTYASSPHSILGAVENYGRLLLVQGSGLIGELSTLRSGAKLSQLAGDVASGSVDKLLPGIPNPCKTQ